MKKFSILLVAILLFGCQNVKKTNIQFHDISYTLNSKDDEIELLRVEENNIFINELDTFTNPFLFTTRNLIITDKEGRLKENHQITTNKRITDFVRFNGKLYYFNLISKDEKAKIELCYLDEKENENLLKTYDIDDIYDYPSFISSQNNYFYKINNSIYELNALDKVAEFENDIYISKNMVYTDCLYLKSHKHIYSIKGKTVKKLINIPDANSFIIDHSKLIYTKNKNKSDEQQLYMCDLNNKNEEKIYDDSSVIDFALLQKNILVINTEENIIFYDLNQKHISETIDKSAKHIKGTLWIKTNHQNDFFFEGDNNNIVQITVN